MLYFSAIAPHDRQGTDSMSQYRPSAWRRWLGALGVALAASLYAGALGACSSPGQEPTEPPVTIMRAETATPTPTPTLTPGAPAPAAAGTPGAYPEVSFTPGPTSTAGAYPSS